MRALDEQLAQTGYIKLTDYFARNTSYWRGVRVAEGARLESV